MPGAKGTESLNKIAKFMLNNLSTSLFRFNRCVSLCSQASP